jgi:hypothetical protein
MLLAIERYSQQQVKEDHAAAYLSDHAFPQASWLLPFFFLGNFSSAFLGKVLPSSILKPPIQSLCSETLTAYSEVRGFWVLLSSFTLYRFPLLNLSVII